MGGPRGEMYIYMVWKVAPVGVVASRVLPMHVMEGRLRLWMCVSRCTFRQMITAQ